MRTNMSPGIEACALHARENNARMLSLSLSLSLSLLVYFSFSSLFFNPLFLLLFAPPALLLVLLSGHMGTFGIMGWERLERKSSAYNRLDEI